MYNGKAFWRVGSGDASGPREVSDDSARMALLARSYLGE